VEKETKALTYDNLISIFLDEFPEFREVAEKHKSCWQEDEENDELVYVFFGWLTDPIIELISKNKNKKLLYKLFQFFERMANSAEEVQEVLGVEIIESFITYTKTLKNARKYMGENTLKMSFEIEPWFSKEK
jgi:hypothetical protein